jgi:hypothetical protein
MITQPQTSAEERIPFAIVGVAAALKAGEHNKNDK